MNKTLVSICLIGIFLLGCISTNTDHVLDEYKKNSDTIEKCTVGQREYGCMLVKTTDKTLQVTLFDDNFDHITYLNNEGTTVTTNGKSIKCGLANYTAFNPFDTDQKHDKALNLTYTCDEDLSNINQYEVKSRLKVGFEGSGMGALAQYDSCGGVGSTSTCSINVDIEVTKN